MKTKIYKSLMLVTLIVAALGAQAQEIIGYSDLFTFDTRITNVIGIVSEAGSGNAVQGANVILTGASQTFTDISLVSGAYSLTGVPTGNYNLAVMKPGYQSFNQNVFINGSPTQIINVSLIPGGSNFVEINSMLTAYANNIVESPSNFFTLSGNININNILYFSGEIKIDRRANLQSKEVFGNGSIYVPNVGGTSKIISPGGIPFKFYESDDTLFAKSESYFFELPVLLGGFPLTLAAIKLAPASQEARLMAIPKLPYPVDYLINEYLDEDIPTAIKYLSGIIIYSMQTGENIEVNLNNLKANLGLVAIKDMSLYYQSMNQVFGGNLLLRFPGTPKKPSRTELEGDSLLVIIKDEEGKKINEISLNEFVETMRILGSDFIEIYMELEFVSGALNNLAVTISNTHIPLFTTGLFITEIHGGVYGLASKDWHLEASVDIETGLSIPAIGKAPVKLDDFGVMIQPMNIFKGGGTFQVFESNVAGGFVEYNRPKSSITMEGQFNLASILDGGLYANLQHKKFTGSGYFTVSTPCDLPWYLFWAECRTVGSAYAEVNNQNFQSEVDLSWIRFAQKMEFGKQGFPWFHYYLGRNLNNLYQIWKGTRDGKQSVTFLVPENTGQLLIVAMDTINPTLFDITLQSPTGQLFNMNNVHHYEQNEIHQQTIMSLLQPVEGEWYLLTAYEDDIALYIMSVDQKPSVMVDQPFSKRSRSNDISLTFNDYADTVKVQVFYNTNNKRFDGSFIDEFTLINNATLNFTWENQDVPNGEYYIYSRIDDGKNAPVLQYAPGSIWVENDPDIETPQNLGAIQQADSVNVSWDTPQQPNTFAATVYYKDLSTGRTGQQAVVDNNETTLKNLVPGRGYEIWCKFINDIGTYSSKSNVVNLEFASATRNNPPYFTMDRESILVFIVGKTAEYILTANDADGDILTFSIPNDTLGFNITGNQLSWLPDIEQRGVYHIMFVVSDGSETDTTKMQVVVYTPEQVETRLAFNSVRLYEADNTFIILNNFQCVQPTQNVTLTNTRTLEQATIECRKVNDFEYMGQFFLSFQSRSEITVAEGDTIKASYTWDDETYNVYAYYDSNPQPTDQTPPGIISDLMAERMENNRVKLKWTATGNDGEIGKAYRYDIRYAYEPIVSEGDYFVAFLIENFPYPSVAGEQDSIIINLSNLQGITGHDTIFFSIKAEDEMQNRSALGNTASVDCLLAPVNITATIENVYKVILEWDGPVANNRGETGFQYYNVFRKINDGNFIHVVSDVGETTYTDNVKNLPDGNYTYGIQAVYETGNSDTIQSSVLNMQRFVSVNMLVTLKGRTNHTGIEVEITGLDTVYTHQFTRTTNPTGLLILPTVYKSAYAIEASKEGYHTLNDTIVISNTQKSFAFELTRIIPELAFLEGLSVPFEHDTCFEATQTITVSNTTIESGAYARFIAGYNILFQEGTVVLHGGNLHAWITTDDTYCIHPETMLAPDGDMLLEPAFTKEAVITTFFKVYPNPTTGTFNLQLNKTAKSAMITIEIYTMLGERILQTQLTGQQQYEFDLSGRSGGVYLVRVVRGDEVGVEKVVKQ